MEVDLLAKHVERLLGGGQVDLEPGRGAAGEGLLAWLTEGERQ